jgi:hypothetical protein
VITPETVKAHYGTFLTDRVTVRRYTGTGPIATKPRHDVSVRARVKNYEAKEFVGPIQHGDRKAILYAQDIIDGGLTLPLTASDKVFVGSKELAIVSADHDTRKVDDVLIAVVAQVRG